MKANGLSLTVLTLTTIVVLAFSSCGGGGSASVGNTDNRDIEVTLRLNFPDGTVARTSRSMRASGLPDYVNGISLIAASGTPFQFIDQSISLDTLRETISLTPASIDFYVHVDGSTSHVGQTTTTLSSNGNALEVVLDLAQGAPPDIIGEISDESVNAEISKTTLDLAGGNSRLAGGSHERTRTIHLGQSNREIIYTTSRDFNYRIYNDDRFSTITQEEKNGWEADNTLVWDGALTVSWTPANTDEEATYRYVIIFTSPYTLGIQYASIVVKVEDYHLGSIEATANPTTVNQGEVVKFSCYGESLDSEGGNMYTEWKGVVNGRNAGKKSLHLEWTASCSRDTSATCYYKDRGSDPVISKTVSVTVAGCEIPEPPITGCTDPTATNYNPNAQENDASCRYSGCTDSTATNYNPKATDDDGSCHHRGCTDTLATNYNPNATEDDGTCVFDAALGCTDPVAENYDPDATADDGSCTYLAIPGCMSQLATNYNPEATEEDGSCIFPETNTCTCEEGTLNVLTPECASSFNCTSWLDPELSGNGLPDWTTFNDGETQIIAGCSVRLTCP